MSPASTPTPSAQVAARLAVIRRRIGATPRTPTEALDLFHLAMLLDAIEAGFALHPLGARHCPTCMPNLQPGRCSTGTHMLAALLAHQPPTRPPDRRPCRTHQRDAVPNRHPTPPAAFRATDYGRRGRRVRRSWWARRWRAWQVTFWSCLLMITPVR